jgi:FtsZ-binding cell division protein ZapB
MNRCCWLLLALLAFATCGDAFPCDGESATGCSARAVEKGGINADLAYELENAEHVASIALACKLENAAHVATIELLQGELRAMKQQLAGSNDGDALADNDDAGVDANERLVELDTGAAEEEGTRLPRKTSVPLERAAGLINVELERKLDDAERNVHWHVATIERLQGELRAMKEQRAALEKTVRTLTADNSALIEWLKRQMRTMDATNRMYESVVARASASAAAATTTTTAIRSDVVYSDIMDAEIMHGAPQQISHDEIMEKLDTLAGSVRVPETVYDKQTWDGYTRAMCKQMRVTLVTFVHCCFFALEKHFFKNLTDPSVHCYNRSAHIADGVADSLLRPVASVSFQI